jgi:protein O-GlcNAc transferase
MPQIAIIHQQVSQDFDRGDFLAGLQKLDDLICSGKADLQTWALTGSALLKVREYAQALDAWSHAVDLDATNTQAYLGLARAHYYLGEVSQAVAILRRILQQSDNLEACTILAIICPGDPETSPDEILSIRRQFDQLASRTIGEQLPSWQNRPCNLGRLRIGYISAYFHQANYMRPVRPLINAHHTDQFEIHLFADDATSSSFDWLKNPSATVHLVTDLDNVELIQKIRQQNLDILIDLNGYSVPSRLPIYTHRLAQQVAAWFNMYATSGLRCIDYLIGDPWVLNDHETSHYSERLIKLPTSYLSFGAQFDAPDVFQRRAEIGMHSTSTNRFTFGSLVSQYKITDQVLQTWAKILRSVPSAKLSLANRTMQSTSNREYLKARLARFGVSESQYDFCLQPAIFSSLNTTPTSTWHWTPFLTTEEPPRLKLCGRVCRYCVLMATAGLPEPVNTSG